MKEATTIRETEIHNGAATKRITTIDEPEARPERRATVAQKVVWYIMGIIIALLLIRFVFALLGANQNNGIATFVYNVTAPLVAPFTNLFTYDGVTYGVSRLEVFTLVAIAIYTLIGYGLVKLFDFGRRR